MNKIHKNFYEFSLNEREPELLDQRTRVPLRVKITAATNTPTSRTRSSRIHHLLYPLSLIGAIIRVKVPRFC